jgi:DNA-binding response OmpR family regulator
VSFTPTETRLLAVLADGQPHRRAELLACLGDTQATRHNLWWHVYRLRHKIPPGQAIVCELARDGSICYRQVVLLSTCQVMS